MKHNTFLRKLPMIIGALTIILFSLMAAECPSSDDDDKKAATLSFSEENITASASLLKVDFKKDGGVKKGGEADTKHYYLVGDPDGTKTFTLTAKAAKSKGTITYKLKTAKLDTTKKKLEIKDADKDKDGTVDKDGKVTIKDGKVGFYYLEATVAANGDYKAASAKALLLVGAVPVLKEYIVIDKLERGTGTITDMVVLNKAKTEVTIDEDLANAVDKKFTLIAKIDYSKVPPEAPLSDITLSIYPTDKIVDGADTTAKNKITLDINNDKTAATLKAALAAPYVTTTVDIAEFKAKP